MRGDGAHTRPPPKRCLPLTPKPPYVNTVVTKRSHIGGEERATAVVTVATEVSHTRARIKYARAREKRNREERKLRVEIPKAGFHAKRRLTD